MALNIKNSEVEMLAEEVSALANETKTEAIRVALTERKGRLKRRLSVRERREGVHEFLAQVVWPQIPPEVLGRSISKSEREAILGIGPDGV